MAGRIAPRRFEDRYWSHYEPPEPGQELLDFGCGSDRFLNRARKLGWRTVGIDFHPTAVSTARASGHRAYLLTDRVWDELPEGSKAPRLEMAAYDESLAEAELEVRLAEIDLQAAADKAEAHRDAMGKLAEHVPEGRRSAWRTTVVEPSDKEP